MASVEGLISGPFAEALAGCRERLNAKFAAARHARPSLDKDVFLTHLRTTVSPIVDSVFNDAPEKISFVTEVLYDLSLDLAGQEILGALSPYPAVNEGWKKLLPSVPKLLATDPSAVACAVTNAIVNLSVSDGARPGEWTEAMEKIGKHCFTVGAFLDAGIVTAWRCGLAHFRAQALETAKKLDASLVKTALGFPDKTPLSSVDEALAELKQDPWFHPRFAEKNHALQKKLCLVKTVGEFKGFGGPFRFPPKAHVRDGQLIVFDEPSHAYALHADAFGATLIRANASGATDENEKGAAFTLSQDGRVMRGNESASFPYLSHASSSAATEHTLAVTSPYSHKIFLIADACRQ